MHECSILVPAKTEFVFLGYGSDARPIKVEIGAEAKWPNFEPYGSNEVRVIGIKQISIDNNDYNRIEVVSTRWPIISTYHFAHV